MKKILAILFLLLFVGCDEAKDKRFKLLEDQCRMIELTVNGALAASTDRVVELEHQNAFLKTKIRLLEMDNEQMRKMLARRGK